MSDTNEEPPEETRRPFASYTSTDHARVALSARLFTLAGYAHQALIPENAASHDALDAGIDVALDIMRQARDIMDAAVIAAYESGLTWQPIGQLLSSRGTGTEGITRQSAWNKYAPAVTGFHEQLAGAADRAERGEDPIERGHGPWSRRICDTASYAPRLENVASTVEYPAALAPVRKPGEFTGTLSNPATACSAPIHAGVRGPDQRPGQCRYTPGPDGFIDDGERVWLVCTLGEGHRGEHQLAGTVEDGW